MALRAVTEGLNHGWEHVLPILHLYSQNGQTHAELYSNWLRPGCKVLEQQEDLASKRWKLAWGNLRREIVSQLRND